MTTIMVIDDSNTVLKAAEAALRGSGYDVLTASDGFSAMSGIADHQPGLIFIDIVMPRLDGYQACALIKRSQRFRHTPVIMLSSKDGLFDRARGRIVGAEAHINKPFSKSDLLDAVKRYLNPAPDTSMPEGVALAGHDSAAVAESVEWEAGTSASKQWR